MTTTKTFKTIKPADMVVGREYVVTYVGRVNGRARHRGRFQGLAPRGKNARFDNLSGGTTAIRLDLIWTVQEVVG